ncbi:MAG: magnesium transporter [Candidatus Aenigmatarchaeota archaeon]
MQKERDIEAALNGTGRPGDREAQFRSLPQNEQGRALLNMRKTVRLKILSSLSDSEVIGFAHYLDPDEATDLLQSLDPKRRKRITGQLNDDLRTKVELLLKFNPKTAAGLMSLDYVEVGPDAKFGDVCKTLREHECRTGKFPTILVMDKGALVGELLGHIPMLHESGESVAKYVKKVPHITYDAGETEVVKTFKKHRHNKVVVTDDDGSILGVIYSDDILPLITRHSTESFYGFAGVEKEEDIFDPPLLKVKNRYRWLLVNLVTAFFVAFVVGLFQDTLSAFTLLAVYMPVIAGISGNAGTQTLAVVVRGLSLNEINPKAGRKIIFNEMLAGAMNGLIVGSAISVFALAVHSSPLLGAIVGISIIVNLILACFFGSTAPLLMKKLGKDPATSSAVFITAATDVCGFFVFLWLATVVLL